MIFYERKELYMSENIMALINLVRKRLDLFIKILVLIFMLCFFADYLYSYYEVNILDFESILPQIVKVLLQKVEFILYWLIPFVYSIPAMLFLILFIAFVLEFIIEQFEKKGCFRKLSEAFYELFSTMKSWCQFISNQSYDLLRLSIIYISFIGTIYYILAMFNHIGNLVSPVWYSSSFEIINPLKQLISISALLPNMAHREWIQFTFVLSKGFVWGYCIYWFYISLYLSIKRERELFRKRNQNE